MQTGDSKIVVELIKREDGTVAALGGSFELPLKEAEKLVKAGTHKFENKPLRASEDKAAKEQITEEGKK